MFRSATSAAAKVGVVAVAGLGTLALLSGQANAAKTTTPTVTGTIGIAARVGAASVAGTPTFAYGSSVDLSAAVAGTIGAKDSLYVTVVCTQNGQAVYQWSQFTLTPTFVMAAPATNPLNWDGQAASCAGWLVWRQVSGKNYTTTYLANVPFNVG